MQTEVSEWHFATPHRVDVLESFDVDDGREGSQVALQTGDRGRAEALEERPLHHAVVAFFLITEQHHERADIELPTFGGHYLPREGFWMLGSQAPLFASISDGT